MRRLARVLLLITLVLTACTGSGTPTSPPSPASVTVNLVTNPDPAKVGDVELRFTVTDAEGQPVTNADFDVFADHTDMRGMTMHGKATEQGNGQYSITADFSMAGNWKLSIAVKKEGLDHKQDIELKIQ